MSTVNLPRNDSRASSGLASWQAADPDPAAGLPRGPGLFEVTAADGKRFITNVRRLAGAERAPGSALIGVAAWLLALIGGGALYVSFTAQQRYVFVARHQDIASVIEALLLDLLMIVFTLLALGLSRAGKSSRTERALILACAAASAYMNVSAADTASPRSVVAYAVAPVALAVVVDRVVAVIRRHVQADAEASAWTALGSLLAVSGRLAGLVLLYALRFALAAPSTAAGLRRMVLEAAPLPALPDSPISGLPAIAPAAGDDDLEGEDLPLLRLCRVAVTDGECGQLMPCPEHPVQLPAEPGESKKAHLARLYRLHPAYGDPRRAARTAGQLAPVADLSPGTARAYIAAFLAERSAS